MCVCVCVCLPCVYLLIGWCSVDMFVLLFSVELLACRSPLVWSAQANRANRANTALKIMDIIKLPADSHKELGFVV